MENAGFERFVTQSGRVRPLRQILDNGPAQHADLEAALKQQTRAVRAPGGELTGTDLLPVHPTREADLKPQRVPYGTIKPQSWYLEVLDMKQRWVTAKEQPQNKGEAIAFAKRFPASFRVVVQRGRHWLPL